MQDTLERIKGIIRNVHDKYINYNDSSLIAFFNIVEQKHLKDKKFIIDCLR